MTTGVDGLLKIWDLRQRSTVMQVRSHERIRGEGATAVACHPVKSMIFSGGADSDLVALTRV
eukprot:CAMPEP_0184311700 /NCGR_PEP_ID=MMETSP1049-20130417/44139_1 /TAXON_ID=77928 /ORGANISM="Proteomonas sulcata, Strain CCMP704" /LENGTH=61 /DNA_ID=CAMNT_0026627289 /DNA_START=273 /DNA_END=458 /DNA_ORIENTATION=+